jgi:hypothetical protein
MYNDMTHPVIGLNLTIDNSEIIPIKFPYDWYILYIRAWHY